MKPEKNLSVADIDTGIESQFTKILIILEENPSDE